MRTARSVSIISGGEPGNYREPLSAIAGALVEEGAHTKQQISEILAFTLGLSCYSGTA